MRIGELSRRTGVSIRSLRYYEQQRLLCSRRLENGYRDLGEEAVERVKIVQMYLSLGLTTEQIEEILQCTGITPPLRNALSPAPLAISPTPLAMSAPLRSAPTYAPHPAPLRSAQHTLPTPFPQPLPVCEEVLLSLYQDKLQDIEHQMAVLTALHTRLKERIACLQRQLQAK